MPSPPSMSSVREQSLERCTQVLGRLYDSALAINIGESVASIVIRDKAVPDQRFDRPEYVLDIHTYENMLHTLVLTALGRREEVEEILSFFSLDAEGTSFPIEREYGFRTTPAIGYDLGNVYEKIQSTDDLHLISADNDFGTKSHAIASIIHSSYKESFTGLLHILDGVSFGGMFHNVYGFDKCPNHYDLDTNAWVAIAFGLEGGIDYGRGILSQFSESQAVYDTSLFCIAQLVNGCKRDTVVHFMDMVKRQNIERIPLSTRWLHSMDEFIEETIRRGSITKSLEASVGYALLLNNLGEKDRAFDIMERVWEWDEYPIKAQIRNTHRSEPLLQLALAYAELSRNRSLFTSKVIDVSATT